MNAIQFTRVRLERQFRFEDDIYKYLVLPWWNFKQLGDIIERQPDEKFNSFVTQQVQMYMEGKSPPDSILSAVMNIADDVISGREPVMKAGDYIALQREYQGM